MSSKPVQKTEYTPVCDLCGKPVDTYSDKDRAALNWGTTPQQQTPRPKHFIFFRRAHGNRVSGAPKGDYREFQWDFHGECLVNTLMPLVIAEARPSAGGIS